MCGGGPPSGAGGENPVVASMRAHRMLTNNPAWMRVWAASGGRLSLNPFSGGMVSADRVFGRFGDPKKEADNPEYLRNPFLDAPDLNGRPSLRINLGDLPVTPPATPAPPAAPNPRPPGSANPPSPLTIGRTTRRRGEGVRP